MNKKNEDLFDFMNTIGKEARKELYKTHSVIIVTHETKNTDKITGYMSQ